MKNLESGDVMNSETETERKPKLEDSFGGTVEKTFQTMLNGLMMPFTLKRHALVYTLAS